MANVAHSGPYSGMYIDRDLNILGGADGAHVFMLVVGVVEMGAGLIVALKPRIGAYVVAAWLAANRLGNQADHRPRVE